MAMYGYVWLGAEDSFIVVCIAMYGYVWLCMAPVLMFMRILVKSNHYM